MDFLINLALGGIIAIAMWRIPRRAEKKAVKKIEDTGYVSPIAVGLIISTAVDWAILQMLVVFLLALTLSTLLTS